jgi:hypothetical protein
VFRHIVYLIQKAVVIVLVDYRFEEDKAKVTEAKMAEPVEEEPPVDPVSDSQKDPCP